MNHKFKLLANKLIIKCKEYNLQIYEDYNIDLNINFDEKLIKLSINFINSGDKRFSTYIYLYENNHIDCLFSYSGYKENSITTKGYLIGLIDAQSEKEEYILNILEDYLNCRKSNTLESFFKKHESLNF